MFSIKNSNAENDMVDLSESMMSEGARIKMPQKNYKVNKPIEQEMNFKIMSEEELISDSSSNTSQINFKFDVLDKEKEAFFEKKSKFTRRSKSVFNINELRNLRIIDKFESEEMKIKEEPTELFNDISISQVNISIYYCRLRIVMKTRVQTMML